MKFTHVCILPNVADNSNFPDTIYVDYHGFLVQITHRGFTGNVHVGAEHRDTGIFQRLEIFHGFRYAIFEVAIAQRLSIKMHDM